MKRFLFVLLIISSLIIGKGIEETKLNEVGKIAFMGLLQQQDAVEILSAKMFKKEGVPTYYSINFRDGGWVLLTTDDRLSPILAMGKEGIFKPDTTNKALMSLLSSYEEQIYDLRTSQTQALMKQNNAWDEATINSSYFNINSEVDPLIKTKWGQKSVFNDDVPNDYPAGCVAIAMAQIMNFHQHPFHGLGQKSYSWNGQTLSTNFQNKSFSWNVFEDGINYYDFDKNMSDEVAETIRDIGYSVEMNYGPGGSSANSRDAKNAFVDYFKYSDNIDYIKKSDYSEENWNQILLEQLNDNQPIYYRGNNSFWDQIIDEYTGHAFVVDGYTEYGTGTLYHVNWGWYGEDNDYYKLDELNPASYDFSYDNAAIINIKPNRQYYTYTQSIGNDFNYISNETISYIINLKYRDTEIPAFGYTIKVSIKKEDNTFVIRYKNTVEEENGLYRIDFPAPTENGNYYLYTEIWTSNLSDNNVVKLTENIIFSVDGEIDYVANNTITPNNDTFLPEADIVFNTELSYQGQPASNKIVYYYVQRNGGTQISTDKMNDLSNGNYSISLETPTEKDTYLIGSKVYSNGNLVFQSSPEEINVINPRTNLLYPSKYQENIPLSCKFKWEEEEHAESYDFAIYDYIDGTLTQIYYEGDLSVPNHEIQGNVLDYGEGYKWTARINLNGENGEWAVLSDFRTENYLSEPVLQSPYDQIVNTSLFPTFRWSKVDNADYYKLTIATDKELDENDEDYIVEDATNFILKEDILNEQTIYFWSVRAYNSEYDGDYTEPNVFTTGGVVPPTQPELFSPYNFELEVAEGTIFSWEPGEGVTYKYDIELSENLEFSNILFIKKDHEGTSLIVPAGTMVSNQKHYWRVKSNNNSGESEYSEIFEFTSKVFDGEGTVIMSFKNLDLRFLATDNEGFYYTIIDDNVTYNNALAKIDPNTFEYVYILNQYSADDESCGPTISHDGRTIYTIVDDDADPTLFEPNNMSYLAALNKRGDLLWHSSTFGRDDALKPIIDADGNIYVYSIDYRPNETSINKCALLSFDPNGTQRWAIEFDDDNYSISHPVVVNNKLIFFREGGSSIPPTLYAYNTNSTLAWSRQFGADFDAYIEYSLAASENALVFAERGNDDRLYAVNPETGADLTGWPIKDNDNYFHVPLLDNEGNIYISRDDYDEQPAKIYSFSSNGQMRWSYDNESSDSSPTVLGDDHNYYCVGEIGGEDVVFCLNKDTGIEKWRITVGRSVRSLTIGFNGILFINTTPNTEGITCYAVKTDAAELLEAPYPAVFANKRANNCVDEPNIEYVLPPVHLKATEGDFNNKIVLNWTNQEIYDSLKVYRSLNDDNFYKVISTVQNNNYEDSQIELNLSYYYKIQSYKNNLFSDINDTKAVSGYTEDLTPVSFTLTEEKNPGRVELTWNNPPNLESIIYDISRAVNDTALVYSDLVTELKELRFTDYDIHEKTLYYYRIRSNYDGRIGEWTDAIPQYITNVDDFESTIPNDYFVDQNYPNPFNPTTTIKYGIPQNRTGVVQNVMVVVFDILGSVVATLVNEKQSAGNYSIKFDASNLTSGIYFYKLQAGEFVETKKLLLIK